MHRTVLHLFFLFIFLTSSFPGRGSLNASSQTTPMLTTTPAPQAKPPVDQPLPYWGEYSLKNWTEADAEQAIKAINSEQLKDSNDFNDYETWQAAHAYNQDDYNYTFMIANYERLLRFPDPQKESDFYLQIASDRPDLGYWDYFQSAFRSAEPFRDLLEKALNNSEAIPESLNVWFKRNYLPITVEERITNNNLFGKGKPGQVFELENDQNWSILLVLEGSEKGAYHLYFLPDDWTSTFQDHWTIKVDDLTGNGQAEIALQHTWHGVGITHECGQATQLFEWNGQQFQDLMNEVDSFYMSTDFGDCGGWNYLPGPFGSKIVAVKKLIGIGCWKIRDFTQIMYYQWDGKKYTWLRTEAQPYDLPDRPDCAANWAYEAGPHDDQATAILEDTLKQRPYTLNETWGVASEDYLRYKLGLWYAFRGEKEKAINTLEQVRDQPAYPEYQTASKIASVFLNEYQKRGALAGCNAVINSLSGEFESFKLPWEARFYTDYDLDKIRAAWGFGSSDWVVNSRFYSSLGTGRNDETTICSRSEAFRSSIQQASIKNKDGLYRWFYESKVPVLNIKEGDLDGDGTADWLALIELEDIQLWALLHQGNEVQPVEIPISSYYSRNVTTAWQTFQPSRNPELYNAYQLDDDVIVFRFDPQATKSLQVDSRYSSVRRISVSGRAPNQALDLLYSDNRESSLRWDTANEALRVEFSSPSQDEQVGVIEKAIFKDKDPSAARQMIETMLNKGVNEGKRYYGTDEKRVPRVKPYLLYLLGLSYELTNEPKQAVKTYWQLWSLYPENPYSIIARMKLERAKQ